eukprot:TRINITY_DN110979_c0_g1_i1.p1 TRINITY_DN110979_c0_g1~~TRINITY_DN110979_c0_g1_i1.p1  ORF type:complete len:326 (-),score=65.53 TRINITY_DN110979_c0_g1_i1:64-1041(-)
MKVFVITVAGVVYSFLKLPGVVCQAFTSPKEPRACEQDQEDQQQRWSDTPVEVASLLSEKKSWKDDRQKVEKLGRASFEDLRILIPIVKPMGWEEVQPLMKGKSVTFDERGLKETMTVRTSKWQSFVDRQKAKVQKEIQSYRSDFAPSATTKTEDRNAERNESSYGRGNSVEDIAELEQLLERMEDWKDLQRYSGKSISMASTRRGNEMKIYVMAFAEREDGMGVDFMRLHYKKSVEVKNPCVPVQEEKSMGSTLRSLFPFLRSPSQGQAATSAKKQAEIEERWIQLLQRPEVAKFIIALAFKSALENDGITFQFCEASLDDIQS